ncbi:MAG: flagellar biosynthetic protein FliR [Lachnospiraceae bacterium]|nr:flagellar biosynthetic protein FliR [Lachnospiraceae bacterium]
MSFTIQYLEYILLVFIRVTAIVYVAPFFGSQEFPRRLKAIIAFFFTLIVMHGIDYTALEYSSIFSYASFVLKEAITGLLIGLGSRLCLYILNFSGHMVDMEIGFSMVQEMDPTTSINSTVTANFFSYIFMLFFVVSDMHYFIIDAMFDSYELIPMGGAKFTMDLYSIIVSYIVSYFVIGFRIILPIFCCILVINIVLGILAKIAPQMNMFVIGLQLKLFVGLFLIYITLQLFAGVADFLFEEMHTLTKYFIQSMAS